MIEKSNDELGVNFSLPEAITVRQQIKIRSRVWSQDTDEEPTFRFWFGMKPLIKDWYCEEFPYLDEIDLDDSTDPLLADIVTWVSNELAGYWLDLSAVPKET